MIEIAMKRLALAIALTFLILVPSHGAINMDFGVAGIDGFLQTASRIWVINIVKQPKIPQVMEIGDCIRYEVKVVQVLKGDPPTGAASVCTAHVLAPRTRYVAFDFSGHPNAPYDFGPGLIDNGDVSPIPIPKAISKTDLEGKSTKEQLLQIITARIKELAGSNQGFDPYIRTALERGLREDARRERLQEERSKKPVGQ